MESQFDVLIVFHATAVTQDGPSQGVTQAGDILKIESDVNFSTRIIEIGWCSFDMKRNVVIDECQIFVRPSNAFILTPEQVAQTGVTQEDLMKGFSLLEAVQKFNDHCYYNYTSHNKSFCLATCGDITLTLVIPNEVVNLGIKLPQHFFQYFDILHEFQRFYPHTQDITSTPGMLSYLRLKEIPVQNQCQLETKNLVRILNKLVKDKHIFLAPKLLNQRHELIRSSACQKEATRKPATYKKWSGFIRGRSPQAFKPRKNYYIRVRGLNPKCTKEEIIEMMSGVRVNEKRIAKIYDSNTGVFTGEVVIKMFNEMDFREALSYQIEGYGGINCDSPVEIYEARDVDFTNALQTLNPGNFKNDSGIKSELATPLPMLSAGAQIVKISGLSQRISTADIINIISAQVRLVDQGVLRAVVDGQNSSEAYVIVNSDSDVSKVSNLLNNQTISGSSVTVKLSSREQLGEFLRDNFIKRDIGYMRNILPNIEMGKRNRILVMNNLPLNLHYHELVSVFRNDNIVETELIMLRGPNGMFNGTALITFEDESDARQALKTKNLIYIRNQYVELLEFR